MIDDFKGTLDVSVQPVTEFGNAVARSFKYRRTCQRRKAFKSYWLLLPRREWNGDRSGLHITLCHGYCLRSRLHSGTTNARKGILESIIFEGTNVWHNDVIKILIKSKRIDENILILFADNTRSNIAMLRPTNPISRLQQRRKNRKGNNQSTGHSG